MEKYVSERQFILKCGNKDEFELGTKQMPSIFKCFVIVGPELVEKKISNPDINSVQSLCLILFLLWPFPVLSTCPTTSASPRTVTPKQEIFFEERIVAILSMHFASLYSFWPPPVLILHNALLCVKKPLLSCFVSVL